MMLRMILTHLLYLHGFRSSPRSAKAQRMAQWAQHQAQPLTWLCPQLPPSPAEALALVQGLIQDWPSSMAVVGSSLGGYYAAHVGAIRQCPTVLLNPAACPARDLQHHLGEQTSWHDPALQFEFTSAHVDELKAWQVGPGTPYPDARATLAVIATGDEVLDWQEMVSRYGHGRVHLIQGSDHGLTDFEQHLPVIEAFLVGPQVA